MPAAIDDDAMTAVLTDADLSLSVEFYGADTSTAEDFTGSTFAWTFTPEGRAKPAADDVHTLTSAAGEVTLGGTNVVSAYKAQAGIANWKPGWYREELRRFYGVGLTEVLYVGRIPIAQGFSQLATMGGGAAIPGGTSGRQIFRDGGSVRVVMGQASGEAAIATIEADAAHADRLLADADQTATHADKLAADGDAAGAHTDRLAADVDAAAARADRLLDDADAAATHADKLAADGDAAAAHTDRLAADGDAAAALADRLLDDADAAATHADKLSADSDAALTAADRVATGLDRTAAAASAAAAAASAASVASQSVATYADINERVAIADPNATSAQRYGTVARGVENRPAATAGKAYFRIGLLTSTSLSGVATFTRATTATQTDQSGTVSSVASGAARVSNAGQLSEEARTNICLQSQVFQTTWSTNASTVGVDATAAPDGTTTADKLIESVANTQHFIAQNVLLAGSTTYALSVYAKAGERSALEISGSASAWGVFSRADFDLAKGTVAGVSGNFTSQTITPLANGWYRCTVIGTSAAAPTVSQAVQFSVMQTGFVSSYAGDGASGLYLWGAQLEAGAFATSYIPTTTAAVARNADVTQETVAIPVGQAFTVTGKFIAPPPAAISPTVFDLIPAAGSADRLSLFCQASGTQVALLTRSANLALAANPTFTITPGNPVGFAISVSGDSVTWSVNGAAAQTFTLAGGTLAQAMTRLFLGGNNVGAAQLNSTLRECNLIMRAMSAAEVAGASDVSLERALDFTTQIYQYIGEAFTSATELPGTTFARASTATVVTLAGYILNVASGVIRASDAGLTVDPASSNLIAWSQALDNAAWVKGALSAVTPDVVVAPDGTSTADQIVNDGTSSQHYCQSSATAVTAGLAYTISTFAKAGTAGFVQVGSTGGIGANSYANFNLSGAGAVASLGATATSATITALGNGWYRCTVTATAASTTTAGMYVAAVSGGAVGRSPVEANALTANFWGSQLEQLGYASGYMATTSAAVIRNADVLTTLDTAPAAFSVLAKFTIPTGGPTSSPVWCWSDGTLNNRVELFLDRSTTHLKLVVTIAGVGTTIDLGLVVIGSTYKVALGMQANDLAVSVNGAAVVTNAALAMPSMTTFQYGTDAANTNFWGPGLQQNRRWRGRRTNAQLIADAT